MKVHWTCPTCGNETSHLRDCDACSFEDLDKNLRYRKLLGRVTGVDVGESVYSPQGCMVCPDCSRVWYYHPDFCPLQIFYGGLMHILSRAYSRVRRNRAREGEDWAGAALNSLTDLWRRYDSGGSEEYRRKILNYVVNSLAPLDYLNLRGRT
ncbi:MAG: hypothetical protein ACUVXI_11040 [bacterium]